MVFSIIIGFLWGIISTMIFFEYIEDCKELSPGLKLFVILIFIIFGPVFALNNILGIILDYILPEGWNDDNDDFKKH